MRLTGSVKFIGEKYFPVQLYPPQTIQELEVSLLHDLIYPLLDVRANTLDRQTVNTVKRKRRGINFPVFIRIKGNNLGNSCTSLELEETICKLPLHFTLSWNWTVWITDIISTSIRTYKESGLLRISDVISRCNHACSHAKSTVGSVPFSASALRVNTYIYIHM